MDMASASEDKTDNEKNMATMFDILRRIREVKLENLILNRNCFAQTVENLLTLSYLIKDGQAEIKVDEDGCHLVLPRNALSGDAILSGELMLKSVGVGEELMPHRNEVDEASDAQSDFEHDKHEGGTTIKNTTN